MKRQRGRSRRSGGGNHNPNKHYESNGPDVKIRGSAQQILDKYQQYARDAQTSGDRVNAENYLQHAEHYSRLIAAMAPKDKPRDPQQDQKAGESRESGSDEAEQSAESGADEAKSQSNGSDRNNSERNDRGRRRQRPNNRRDQNGSEDRADDDAPSVDAQSTRADVKAADVSDGVAEQPEAPSSTPETVAEAAPAPKPRRRSPRKPKVVAAEGDEPTDGIMKTLSRGRKPKIAADAGEASASPSTDAAD